MDRGGAIGVEGKAERGGEVGVDSLLCGEPLEGELVVLWFFFGVEVDHEEVEVELVVKVYFELVPYGGACLVFSNVGGVRTIRVHVADKG